MVCVYAVAVGVVTACVVAGVGPAMWWRGVWCVLVGCVVCGCVVCVGRVVGVVGVSGRVVWWCGGGLGVCCVYGRMYIGLTCVFVLVSCLLLLIRENRKRFKTYLHCLT